MYLQPFSDSTALSANSSQDDPRISRPLPYPTLPAGRVDQIQRLCVVANAVNGGKTHRTEVSFMSPRVSTKAPIRLLNIRKYPDVFKALLLNAQVIARDVKEHYLVETDNL